MSYILDALKKAEADRDPDIRSRLAVEQLQRRRHRLLISVLAVALIANATMLAWLFLPDTGEPEDPAAHHAQVPAPNIHEQPGSGEATPDSAVIQPGGEDAQPHRMVARQPDGEPVQPSRPVDRHGLPAAQRMRFPDLQFSTHIYADAADLRAVVVNGTRLVEGDRLGELVLQEITEEGAVFRFENRLVSVNVLEDWE